MGVLHFVSYVCLTLDRTAQYPSRNNNNNKNNNNNNILLT